MALDGNYSSDAYSDMVASQQEYVDKKAKYVRGELKDNCDAAEDKMENTYTDYRIAKNIFAGCSDEKATLQANLEKIQVQKQLEINNAVRKARAEGKSDLEIRRITQDIENNYAGTISQLQFNISRTGATAVTKYNTMSQAESSYRGARSESIFLNGSYVSELMSLTGEYLSLGRMQQNQRIAEEFRGWNA